MLPSWLTGPLWEQFTALLPQRSLFDPAHPLGCHRRRIRDRIAFDKLLQVLWFGCSYESIAPCRLESAIDELNTPALQDPGALLLLYTAAIAPYMGMGAHARAGRADEPAPARPATHRLIRPTASAQRPAHQNVPAGR